LGSSLHFFLLSKVYFLHQVSNKLVFYQC